MLWKACVLAARMLTPVTAGSEDCDLMCISLPLHMWNNTGITGEVGQLAQSPVACEWLSENQSVSLEPFPP